MDDVEDAAKINLCTLQKIEETRHGHAPTALAMKNSPSWRGRNVSEAVAI
jgi:hypothetical protein